MVLICISLIISYVEHIFMLVIHMLSLEIMSIQIVYLLRFVLLKLSFMNSLYILDSNPLLNISFENILSPFHFVGGFLCYEKLFSLM